MDKRKNSLNGLFSILVVLLIASPGPILAQERIKIGFFAPITSPTAVDGTSAKNAVEIGLKEVNDAGGSKGEKVVLETKAKNENHCLSQRYKGSQGKNL